MMGRDPLLPIDIVLPQNPFIKDEVADFKSDLTHKIQSAIRQVKQNQKEYKEKAKKRYDKSHTPHSFKLADLVLLRRPSLAPGTTKKLAKIWKGPYRILELFGDLNLRIVHINNPKDIQRVHANRLKPFFPPEEGRSIVDDSDNDDAEIEDILDCITDDDGVREFKVRWKGYTANDDTWILEENLNAPDLIAKFLRNQLKAQQSSIASP